MLIVEEKNGSHTTHVAHFLTREKMVENINTVSFTNSCGRVENSVLAGHIQGSDKVSLQ